MHPRFFAVKNAAKTGIFGGKRARENSLANILPFWFCPRFCLIVTFPTFLFAEKNSQYCRCLTIYIGSQKTTRIKSDSLNGFRHPGHLRDRVVIARSRQLRQNMCEHRFSTVSRSFESHTEHVSFRL